jgi:hypothetical protein
MLMISNVELFSLKNIKKNVGVLDVLQQLAFQSLRIILNQFKMLFHRRSSKTN